MFSASLNRMAHHKVFVPPFRSYHFASKLPFQGRAEPPTFRGQSNIAAWKMGCESGLTKKHNSYMKKTLTLEIERMDTQKYWAL